jgi:4-hydroxy-tetrahydrodipicolinate synthase
MTFKYTGIFTALITPFKNDEVDEISFINMIKMQTKAMVEGVVVAGTTGESATLNIDEKMRLITLAKDACEQKIKIIAGTGSNNTKEAIFQSKQAQKSGADGLIIVTPYYNRPSQEGLYQHYKAINDEVDIPILLYTVPKRTGIDFSDDTIIRLSKLKNIIAIKDAGDDLVRPTRLANKVENDFCFLTGDDVNFIAYSANGGVGCVSVASNLVPEQLVTLSKHIADNKINQALELQNKLLPLYEVMFCETNPTPVKYAASLLNLCYPEVRLPLVMPEDKSRKKIKQTLITTGLL